MYQCRYIIQLVKLQNFVENSRTCDPYCAEYCFHRFRTHRKLPSKLKQNCIFLNIGYPEDMMLTFWTVRQALLFDLKWSICHVIQRLPRKIDYTGNFYGPGAHDTEPAYLLYPWVNPFLYLVIFRTVISAGFLNFPRKLYCFLWRLRHMEKKWRP